MLLNAAYLGGLFPHSAVPCSRQEVTHGVGVAVGKDDDGNDADEDEGGQDDKSHNDVDGSESAADALTAKREQRGEGGDEEEDANDHDARAKVQHPVEDAAPRVLQIERAGIVRDAQPDARGQKPATGKEEQDGDDGMVQAHGAVSLVDGHSGEGGVAGRAGGLRVCTEGWLWRRLW